MLGLPKSYRQRWEARIPSLAVLGVGGGGDRAEGKNKGPLSAAGSPLSRFPNTWASQRLSNQTRPSKTTSPFFKPKPSILSLGASSAAAAQVGAGERVAKENTKRQQAAAGSQLPPGAHTPSTRRGGGKEGKRGGGTQHLPGEGGMGWEMGGSPKFRGGGE